MAKKNNKTSHVLNLITNGTSSEPETDILPEAGTGATSEASPAASVSGSVVSASASSAGPAAAFEAAATEEHAAALRENAAALRESAAAIREAVTLSEGAGEPLKDEEITAKEEELPLHEGVRPDEFSEAEPVSETEPASVMEPDRMAEAGPNAEIEKPSGHEEAPPAKDTSLRESKIMSVPSGDKTVIVVNKSGENDKISNEIRDQLVSHMEAGHMEDVSEENASEEAALVNEPPKEEVPVDAAQAEEVRTGDSSVEDSYAEDVLEEETRGCDISVEEAPAKAVSVDEVPVEKAGEKQETYRMVNVMEQILGHTDLEKQMENYGVCMCSRCRADVKALILTRLPAKYVVVDESTVAPIIGYYENKFKVRILTEVIKSCMDVKENPRHDRTDEHNL